MKPTIPNRSGIAARFVKPEPVATMRMVDANEILELYGPWLPKQDKPRYAKWRERNPELYRERQRKLMRKRRAENAKAPRSE